MATIRIAGDAVVIKSELKLEEIKLVQKYRPEALSVYGGVDGGEELFAICAADHGSIGKYGAAFAAEDRGEEKFAIITIVEPDMGESPAKYVAEKYGTAISYINDLEQSLRAVVSEIESKNAAVMECIEVL